MNDYISRQEMLADLKAKAEAMEEAQMHENEKFAKRMIHYVEEFPAAEKPREKQACWMQGEVPNNVFHVEVWCPICGEMAMYPEDEDRHLETPFCPYCGVAMDDTVPDDPTWPFYDSPKKRKKTPL